MEVIDDWLTGRDLGTMTFPSTGSKVREFAHPQTGDPAIKATAVARVV